MKDVKQYQQMLRDGKMNRRDFITRMTALGFASGAMGGLMLSANALAETPKRGGRLRLGWYTHSANDTLEPGRLTTSHDFIRAYQVMNTLVRWDRDLNPQPDLAVSWEGSNGNKTWHFALRKGVEFHNGKSFTAADVVDSVNQHRGPDTKSIIKGWLEGITDVKADGDHVVRMDLDAANADLPMYFGAMHASIHPEGVRGEEFDKGMGTGPFRLKSFKPGISMLVERNPNYYDGLRPYLDEIESFGIGETAARLNALLAGDVNFVVRIDPKTVELVKETEGVEFEPTKSMRHVTFPMMADRAPFDNEDLRLGMKFLANRPFMLDTVQQGHGSIANDVLLGPLDKYHCKEIPQREYDVDQAKFHLKKAGYEGGFEIDLHTSEAAAGPTAPDLAVHYRETAAPAGVNVNVIKHPADGYWSAVWMKQTFCMSNWFPRPTADLRLSLTNLSSATWNEGFYKSDKVDAIIKEARGTSDGPARYDLYCEVQKILHEKDGRIIPLFIDFLDARTSNLKGYVAHPFAEGAGCRMSDEVWLA